MEGFDPNDISIPNGNYFALPFTPEESELVLLSVPWDVTTSYRPGTANAPWAMIDASLQLDKYNFIYPGGWRRGIGTLEIDGSIRETSRRLREEAEKVIIHLEAGGSPDEDYARKRLKRINDASHKLAEGIDSVASEWLDQGKRVGLVGGDHSVPLGFIRALARREPFGILQIDAHADLRNSYEGFEHSHASIMHNVLSEFPDMTLTQVGVRDLSEEEMERISTDSRIRCFTDFELSSGKAEGVSWHVLCGQIADSLPENVYVSFDIDGLDPSCCPETGTPVPGGLSYNDAIYLLTMLSKRGKRVVGFDLCEVTPGPRGEWDANVGARILFNLCHLTLLTGSGNDQL